MRLKEVIMTVGSIHDLSDRQTDRQSVNQLVSQMAFPGR